MNRLALCLLATSALLPGAALAQDPSDPPPEAVEAEAAADAQARAEARREYRNYRRLERGAVVPNRWWAPEFVIADWNSYGLFQPAPGHRWVRYYDDALLIDGYGRIWDGRYGLDWSGQYARAEGYGLEHHGTGHAYVTHHGGGYAYPGYGYGPGYGHSYHGGYGYGHAGYSGAWVTETTVTFTPDCCCCAEEAIVEQPYVAPPPPPPPPPPPEPGERG